MKWESTYSNRGSSIRLSSKSKIKSADKIVIIPLKIIHHLPSASTKGYPVIITLGVKDIVDWLKKLKNNKKNIKNPNFLLLFWAIIIHA